MAESRGRPAIGGVAAVDRALAVLTAFRGGDTSLELTELARRTGLVKTTIMRFAVSLEKAGLIARLDDGTYQLGVEVLRLGSAYQQSFELEKHVLPVLKTLVRQLDETAAFYVLHGNKRLCLYRVESRRLMREHVRPGDLRPLDESSTAQAIKQFSGKVTPSRRTSLQFPLYTRGKTDPDTSSIAMPVFGLDNALVGTLTISGPVTRLTAERAETFMEPIRDAAARLTRALGGTTAKVPQDITNSAVA